MTDSQKLDVLISEMTDFKVEVRSELTGLKSELTGLKSEVTGLKSDVTSINKRLDNIDTKVTGIQIDIENDIKPGINIIGENHQSLSNQLNEAIKLSNDVKAKIETNSIQIRHHDSDIKKLQAIVNT